MTRGASHHEPDTAVSATQFVDDREAASRRVLGDRPRVEGGVRVGIDIASAAIAKGAKFIKVTPSCARSNSAREATRVGATTRSLSRWRSAMADRTAAVRAGRSGCESSYML